MKKQTELGKAMDVINIFIGRKLEEAKKIRGSKARIKFYDCLNEKGFTVNYNQFTGKVVSIAYTPYCRMCERVWKNAKTQASK